MKRWKDIGPLRAISSLRIAVNGVTAGFPGSAEST
jgi:hypothetical protein